MQACPTVNPFMSNVMLDDAHCVSIFAVTDPKILLNLLPKWSSGFQETECRAQANTQRVTSASPKQCEEKGKIR